MKPSPAFSWITSWLVSCFLLSLQKRNNQTPKADDLRNSPVLEEGRSMLTHSLIALPWHRMLSLFVPMMLVWLDHKHPTKQPTLRASGLLSADEMSILGVSAFSPNWAPGLNSSSCLEIVNSMKKSRESTQPSEMLARCHICPLGAQQVVSFPPTKTTKFDEISAIHQLASAVGLLRLVKVMRKRHRRMRKGPGGCSPQAFENLGKFGQGLWFFWANLGKV